MVRKGLLAALLLTATFVISCGGGSSSTTTPTPTPTPAGSTLFNFTIGDTPPAGVTILSFEISVTNAVLHQGTTDVSILSAPVRVEVTQLKTESALLKTLGVAPGQYDSITVTFADPEMTIMNGTGSSIGSCAAGAVCKLESSQLKLNPATVDYSGTPFPLNLTDNTTTGLFLDFNLDASVQSDLSIQPQIGFKQLPVVQHSREDDVEEMDDLKGKISAVGNDQFTLQSPGSGQSFTILVDSSTVYEKFGESGLTNDFSSLKAGQIVEVNYKLTGDGSLLATTVDLKEPEQGEELEGTITSVDSATQFTMVVLDKIADMASVQVGDSVTVDVTSASFRIDDEDLDIPSDVSFNTPVDLLVGQTIEVSPASSSSGTSIVAERVRLKTSQFTAQVESVAGSVVTVNNLPGLFTSAGITEIEVRVLAGTEFDNVSDVSALSAGDNLALRGLLFARTGGTPVLLAKKIKKL